MAKIPDEEFNIVMKAGMVAMGHQILQEAMRIAAEDYKIDMRYMDDFVVSIRDLREIVDKLIGSQ